MRWADAASDESVRRHAAAAMREMQAALRELRAAEESRRASRRPRALIILLLAAASAAAVALLHRRLSQVEEEGWGQGVPAAPDIVGPAAGAPAPEPAPPPPPASGPPEPAPPPASAPPEPVADAPAGAPEPSAQYPEGEQVPLRLDEVEHWRGRPVLDTSGQEIGPLQEVYFDDSTGTAEWALVAIGRLRPTLRFVPLAGARFDEKAGVTVAFPSTQVSDSPELDADGKLSDDEEIRLYGHYGLERPATFRMRRG